MIDDKMSPHSLLNVQSDYLEKMEKGTLTVEETGDFGAYKALKDGLPQGLTLVGSHGILPELAKIYANEVRKRVESDFSSILDLGCGIGATTHFLAKSFNAKALGVDLATDAIDIAKSWYEDCQFKEMAVDSNTTFHRQFDLIHAREFYPFVRVASQETQAAFLGNMLNHLAPDGCIAIMCCVDPARFHRCIFAHLDFLTQQFPGYTFQVVRFPRLRCIQFGFLGNMISWGLDLFRVGRGRLLIVRKN